ncbi:MAG: primosomal protein N' [Phycisphaerales bacterium]|nr:MAG: primosomal protein N' [Phycisphaerales bacterium]
MPDLFPSEAPVAYARVAVERGMDQYPEGLTYGVPAAMADLTAGQRVFVPLGRGNKLAAGYVIDIKSTSPLDPEAVKLIDRPDEAAVCLPGRLLDLARFISSYYYAPIGLTLGAMLPAAVKRNIGAITRTFIDLGDPPPLDKKLPSKQRTVLEVLAATEPQQRPVEIRDLMKRAELKTTGPIKRLLDRGLLEATHRTSIEASWASRAVDSTVPDELTPAQTAAIDGIGSTICRGFSTHLLSGVTGSGKTEVYIRLMQTVLDAGKTALMLVPEISLTPQTGGRLIGRFPKHRVAVLHSGLTAAQRHHQWAIAAAGEAGIVLGARSAVFAPIPDGDLGLIVVDEEHDGSYKQDQTPRYHGRDVAIRRAQIADCPIVLGSATPSLESWHNAAEKQTYRLHRLPDRVPGLRLPKVKVVDFVEERRKRTDRRVHLLGPILESAIDRTLQSGGQVLLLLNRRGYANYIACPDQTCGWLMTCDHCDVTVVYHLRLPAAAAPAEPGRQREGYVRCHHCQAEQKLPATCPQCGNRITTFGLGTQRVEDELSDKFPQLISGETMMRMDSDSMRGAATYHDVLGRFGAGDLRLLIGTQLIAKGLDYPGVRLVGVINADTAINLPDFRASERTFQLVSQVAGRCGRGDAPGLVIVQSFNPQAEAIRLAAAHDYEGFAAIELAQRRQCNLPPISRMARIVIRDEDHVQCMSNARRLAGRLDETADESIRIRGPAPCPIARIAGRHRWQIEIFAPSAADLQKFLARARSQGLLVPGPGMAIDVDPIALL